MKLAHPQSATAAKTKADRLSACSNLNMRAPPIFCAGMFALLMPTAALVIRAQSVPAKAAGPPSGPTPVSAVPIAAAATDRSGPPAVNTNPATHHAPSLRFAPGPTDAPALVTSSVKDNLLQSRSPLVAHVADLNSLQTKPPLVVYALNFREVALGAGLDSASTEGFDYLTEAEGKLVALTSVAVDAAGSVTALRTGNFPGQFFGDVITEGLTQLTASLTGNANLHGSYEVRLIDVTGGTDPPFTFMAFWLKADPGAADLIYPFSFKAFGPYWQRPNSVQLNQFSSVADFLNALRPYLKWTSEAALNDYYVSDFVSVRGAGTGRLSSHLMSVRKNMLLISESSPPTEETKSAAQAYSLDSLELIGVAMHKPPLAFASVPMVKIGPPSRGAPTSSTLHSRTLTDFETKSVDLLRAGQQIASLPLDGGDRIVVGAIRAQDNCLQCHAGAKIGDLLGAFSYHLRPVKPATSPTVAPSP